MGILHRMTDAELPALLALLAQAGGTARTADSWRHDRMTALVLGSSDAPQAAMPMARRTIPACPGRTLDAGWLSSNQFASRMGLRRQTRGTAPEWAALVPELDALLVLRRDEPSLAARWYAQTGFADVLSVRCLYLDMEAPPLLPATGEGGGAGSRYHVRVVSPSEGQWDAGVWQTQMLAVYRDVYAATGGAPARWAGFWEPALAHHYYGDHYQFQIIGLWSAPASPPPPPPPQARGLKSPGLRPQTPRSWVMRWSAGRAGIPSGRGWTFWSWRRGSGTRRWRAI